MVVIQFNEMDFMRGSKLLLLIFLLKIKYVKNIFLKCQSYNIKL